MLVKLLKNDYYNRGRTILVLCLANIVNAFVIDFIASLDLRNNGIFEIVFGMISVLGVIFLYLSFPIMLFTIVADFGKRFFKDEGYFTHTLPVKTSMLIISRMVGDVISTAVITITYLMVGVILSEEFSVIKWLMKDLRKIYSDREPTVGEENLVFALRVIVFFLTILLILWHFNAAYSSGHVSCNGKRIKTVGYFIVYYIAEVFVMAMVTRITDDIFVNKNYDDVQMQLIILVYTVIMELLGVIALGSITHYVCRKKLNLG